MCGVCREVEAYAGKENIVQHKNCGGYLVEGPNGYEGLVCQKCNKDIHLDDEIDDSERPD